MVFMADPRAGYGTFEFNWNWFLEYLSERDMKLVNKGKCPEDEETNERKLFAMVDRAFYQWCVYKLFTHKIPGSKVDGYETAYELLYDVVEEYIRKHPDDFKLCDVDDPEDDDELICVLCDKEIKDDKYGHNSAPLAEGKCCTKCNLNKVIVARMLLASK